MSYERAAAWFAGLVFIGSVTATYIASSDPGTMINNSIFALIVCVAAAFSILRPYFADKITPLEAGTLLSLGLISAVSVGAIVHSVLGLVPSGCSLPCDTYTKGDWHTGYYFSMVTFTTLGYGDYQPQPSTRFLAVGQALVGYVYLGLIVSAASHWATTSEKRQ